MNSEYNVLDSETYLDSLDENGQTKNLQNINSSGASIWHNNYGRIDQVNGSSSNSSIKQEETLVGQRNFSVQEDDVITRVNNNYSLDDTHE